MDKVQKTVFTEIIAVYSEPYKTHKYKMQSCWLLKRVVHIFTTGL
jgi:hypothetical protein